MIRSSYDLVPSGQPLRDAKLNVTFARFRSNPLIFLLSLVGIVSLIHYAFIMVGRIWAWSHPDILQASLAELGWSNQTISAIPSSGYHYKDIHPVRTARSFLLQAEQEIQRRSLDTCHSELSLQFALAYNTTALSFCTPTSPSDESTSITCLPNRHADFLSWWPYPASYCFSHNLLLYPPQPSVQPPTYRPRGCEITPQGEKLRGEMGRERFLGSELGESVLEDGCEGGRIDHGVMFIGRQDQWNPFHVVEDFVTTFLALILTSLNQPDMAEEGERLQLVFTDEFELDRNHFTSVWDRIGTFPPRRLSLDPFKEKTCMTKAVHSIGAGASLFSAKSVGKPYMCTSSLTWAASTYFRHLFGLSSVLPASPTGEPSSKRPINVLWLSRAQMEQFAHQHNDWSPWRETRHITNEPELVDSLREGLKGLCERGGRCWFRDGEEEPEVWPLGEESGGKREVRFARIDPFTQTIETQIDYVGHSTILLSLHGGALGLSLFLPPGEATVLELQTRSVIGNYHFHNMAKQMGHQYERLEIGSTVDIAFVWKELEQVVLQAL